jgi:antirestriction protein ArdC
MTHAVLSQSRLNVYDAVTQKIVAAIEEGAGTYKTPWHSTGTAITLPTNAATHAEYRGVNIIALWAEAVARGYSTGIWASYKQWQSLGAQVRKGERGALIVFYKRAELIPTEPEDEQSSPELRFYARASWVFNAAQVDRYVPPELETRSEVENIHEVEAFVEALGATVVHGRTACYRRKTDVIEMPRRDWFTGSSTSSPTETYYATLLHELTHWSGAEHRLNRTFGKRYGDEAYAMEELVAEIGAAFMCAMFGIASEPRPDHAAYVASWLKVLNRDNRAVFAAASKAQEAFEHLAYLATRNPAEP